jgi:isoleucyl-tRNA synthetase
MAFAAVPSKPDFVAQEHAILAFWQRTNAFERSRELRRGQPRWSFIDGPITANNPMAVHHGWGRTYKDLYLRFWTMRGRELRYQNGFDCQGLWVEVEVEKELGFTTKKDIESYGLDRFVLKCKERVLRYAAVQTEQSIRLGYWMDWNSSEQLNDLADKLIQDPAQEITVDGPEGTVTDSVEQIVGRLGMPELGGSYFTFANENNYMIWRFLKSCWERGWVYRGADVIPWCPRCATGISQHEIVTDGYAQLTHRSVTVRFPLRGENGPGSLLVWTTTPWTLTSNVAAAVGPDLTYVNVQQADAVLYLAKAALPMLQGDYRLIGELKGREMVGWTYDGPYDDLPAAQRVGGFTELDEVVEGIESSAVQAHQVIAWEEVGESEGTGIVHIAPGCGAEDFALGREYALPVIAPLDDEGHFLSAFGRFSGLPVAQVTEPIFEDLARKEILYHVEPYTHRYPTCWRCSTELVFRLVDEWFISMGELYDKPREEVTAEEKERSLRYQIMDVVDQIRWIPAFGQARELDWLRNMHDWMISKKRYWGLALPIWVCDECKHFEVVGSDEELEQRAAAGWETFAGHTPHRPFVDAVKLTCSRCGATMSRVADVGNPWLDAGIVSFSTLRYRSDPDYWHDWFPADWVSESFPGQFRNWFYSLLTMGTVLAQEAPFRALFGYATVLAEDGREMHKSWGNAIEFNEAADHMGVDAMRWLYCGQKPENNLLFGYNRADETRRRFLLPIWNVFSFFVTYANLDGWSPAADPFDLDHPAGPAPDSSNVLDLWIVARLNQVVQGVTSKLEAYDAFAATWVVEPFIDDLTNWYVRRSRRRFWKSELDDDKAQAYATLHHVLVKLASLLAPFVPFISEEIYANLVRGVREGSQGSVHHTSWPEPDPTAADPGLIEQMEMARQIAGLGLSARNSAGIKVRQPLATLSVHVGDAMGQLDAELVEIVTDELNIKSLVVVDDAAALIDHRVLPNNRLLGPRFGAAFPRLRAALDGQDGAMIASRVAAGETLTVIVDGEVHELSPDEIMVETVAREGLAVASERGITVAIDTTITPELAREGQARELVRRVQQLRKDAGLEINDRITLYVVGASLLDETLAYFGDYVRQETLSVALHCVAHSDLPSGAPQATFDVDGEAAILALERQG